MSTDDQPDKGSSAPFVRRPVTWGRPPATVFRAGPLPLGERLPPLPEAPRPGARSAPPSTAGILNGSMIPQAAPTPQAAPQPAPQPTRAPEPTTFAASPARPAPARASAVQPDLTVRPLPSAQPAPQPRRDPALQPVATPVEPTPTVSPGLASSSGRPRLSGRAPLYAGVAAVVIGALAVGGWLLTRPPAAPTGSAPAATVLAEAPAPAPVPAGFETAPPLDAVPDSEPSTPPAAPASVRPSPAATERTDAPPPAPERTAPSTAAPLTPASEPPPPPVIADPIEPRIEIVPAAPAGPPPTTAERPPADPDAPIATRPQPLEAAAD